MTEPPGRHRHHAGPLVGRVRAMGFLAVVCGLLGTITFAAAAVTLRIIEVFGPETGTRWIAVGLLAAVGLVVAILWRLLLPRRSGIATGVVASVMILVGSTYFRVVSTGEPAIPWVALRLTTVVAAGVLATSLLADLVTRRPALDAGVPSGGGS